MVAVSSDGSSWVRDVEWVTSVVNMGFKQCKASDRRAPRRSDVNPAEHGAVKRIGEDIDDTVDVEAGCGSSLRTEAEAKSGNTEQAKSNRS